MNALKERAQAWLKTDPDPHTRAELSALLAEPGNEAELAERFGAVLEFGTAGLRAVLGAGPNRMNRAVVRRTTAGLARYLKKHLPDAAHRGVIVGRDGRAMSPEFLEDVSGVLAAEGLCARVFTEPVPTPLVAYAAVQLDAAAAIVITASHNPPEYNGYKVYWENGAQIIPPHDVGIAAAIDEVEEANKVPLLTEGAARGRQLWVDVPSEVFTKYLQAISDLRVYRRPPKALKVVYTAMHGVGGKWVEKALGAAGFPLHVVAEQQTPDARFPTVRFPNPEEKGAMDLAIALAEKVGADLVLANDPDADRLAAIARDKEGRLKAFSGNEVGVLLGHYLLTRASLPKKPLVLTTIVSSLQLGEIARRLGALYEETLTGFKWIANRALAREREEGATFVFGYEEALGYSAGPVVRDKDGIGSALVLADLAAFCESQGQTLWDYLEEVQRAFGLFVSKQTSVTFPGTAGAATISSIMERFRASSLARMGEEKVVETKDYAKAEGHLPSSNVLSYRLASGARITLRPSGTEPKIKYYFELKEDIRSGEALTDARARALQRLAALEKSFLELAGSK